MNKNVRIAKELVKIAKSLTAGNVFEDTTIKSALEQIGITVNIQGEKAKLFYYDKETGGNFWHYSGVIQNGTLYGKIQFTDTITSINNGALKETKQLYDFVKNFNYVLNKYGIN